MCIRSQTASIPSIAAATKLAAIAYRGVRLARPKPHETVAVIGLGAIGLLAAQLHAQSGARVVAADLGARVVIQGSYTGEFCLPYQAIFMKELSFYVPRDVQPRDIRAMLEVIARGKLNLDALIIDVRAPSSAPETYVDLAEPDTELITVAFEWRE